MEKKKSVYTSVKRNEQFFCLLFFQVGMDLFVITPNPERGIVDATELYVDIYKPKPYEHCFSGKSAYPSFEVKKDGTLMNINPEATQDFRRVHLVINSRETNLTAKTQLELHTKGAQELVLFITDMRYVVPWKILKRAK